MLYFRERLRKISYPVWGHPGYLLIGCHMVWCWANNWCVVVLQCSPQSDATCPSGTGRYEMDRRQAVAHPNPQDKRDLDRYVKFFSQKASLRFLTTLKGRELRVRLSTRPSKLLYSQEKAENWKQRRNRTRLEKIGYEWVIGWRECDVTPLFLVSWISGDSDNSLFP